MILPASKHQDVQQLYSKYPQQILALGFCEGDNVSDCKLICKTFEKFEQLPKTQTERIVMKVAKQTSHLALELTTLSPLYVSQNTQEGAKECALIFNESFYAKGDFDESEESGNDDGVSEGRASS